MLKKNLVVNYTPITYAGDSHRRHTDRHTTSNYSFSFMGLLQEVGDHTS